MPKRPADGHGDLGASFPTEGGSDYKTDETGRPIIKKAFPLLRDAVKELYQRLMRGEARDEKWYLRTPHYTYSPGRRPLIWIRAFGLVGWDGKVNLFGWIFDLEGKLVRGAGKKAEMMYMGSVDPQNFDRSMVALDYLADNNLWGPWSEDFDPMVVESLWRFYDEAEPPTNPPVP